MPAVRKARVARAEARAEPPVRKPPASRRRFSSVKTPTDKRIGKPILFVGLDVHKETISVALAENEGAREVRSHGTISHDLHALEKLLHKLQGEGPERRALRVCYSRTERDRPRAEPRPNGAAAAAAVNAGPCGFGVARRLLQLKIDCQVIAPSLIPQKSGDRQKNDKRDALKLARLHRAGE